MASTKQRSHGGTCDSSTLQRSMLSAHVMRLPVKEGRVPWDVRWVRTKLRNSESPKTPEQRRRPEKCRSKPELRNEHRTKSVQGLRPKGQPIPTGVVGGWNLECRWQSKSH